jgi:hypothetical protein
MTEPLFKRPDPMSVEPDELGHRTRYSDSSVYDEKCMLCGGTDAPGDRSLQGVCLKADPPLDLMVLTLTETVTRRVSVRGQDVEAYLAAWKKAEGHFTDKTPPLLPASAVELSVARVATNAKGEARRA